MPNRRTITIWLLLCATALAGSGIAHAQRQTTALTLSGWPSAPRFDRSARATAVGIRFRAPATIDLATAHLWWRRNGGGCTATLHADLDATPDAALVAAPVPAGTGWQAIGLAAPLVEGRVYHLVVRCEDGGFARLGYVVDAERAAVEAGAWQLEELRSGVRVRRPPSSPLFALAFADGSWWGQPYRGQARTLRLCGREQATATVVPSAPVLVDGVELPLRAGGPYTSPFYWFESIDGTPIDPTAPALDAGKAYLLRLHLPRTDGCKRLTALTTDLDVGRPLTGFQGLDVRSTSDGGRTWDAEPARTVSVSLVTRGNSCGNGRREAHEECDGAADETCPGRCTASCTCAGSAPTTTTTAGATTTTTSTVVAATTTTTLGKRTYKAPYADGYIGHYDSGTIPLWPARMILMRGEANAQGPLIANARQAAIAAGNGDAKFIFYLSLTDMDSRCDCFDQGFYDSFRGAHPEWILKDTNGSLVTTSNGIGRLYATDIGNPAYVQAWADWAFTAIDRYGWDGTFADNIFRGNFDSWSAPPVNPRTGLRYTVAQYRSDMLSALRILRTRYDARGKILIGNHTSAWDPPTFADPVVQQEILTMHGVEIEDCVFNFNGGRQNEASWIAQLRYLDYANTHGVKSVCNGPAGTIGDAVKRRYLLASYLLTKEGFSDLGEINSVGKWWPELAVDLGQPSGRFYCLDPSRGLAPTTSCPSTGKLYGRDWEHGRVLVNPTGATTITVPLGETLLNQGTPVTSVTLAPGSGVMLVRP